MEKKKKKFLLPASRTEHKGSEEGEESRVPPINLHP